MKKKLRQRKFKDDRFKTVRKTRNPDGSITREVESRLVANSPMTGKDIYC